MWGNAWAITGGAKAQSWCQLSWGIIHLWKLEAFVCFGIFFFLDKCNYNHFVPASMIGRTLFLKYIGGGWQREWYERIKVFFFFFGPPIMYLVSNENLPCGKMISDSLPKMSKKDILKNFHLCFSFHITVFLHF